MRPPGICNRRFRYSRSVNSIMNTLTFLVGEDRYAIPTKQVIEIVPWVMLRKIPHAPEYVAGLLNYRGTPVPVIDFSSLLVGCPSRKVLNTRIILVDYPDNRGSKHVLGILAERIGISDSKKNKTFVDTGISVTDAPYLGDISIEGQEMTQVVDIDKLLPDSLRESLFPAQETSAS